MHKYNPAFLLENSEKILFPGPTSNERPTPWPLDPSALFCLFSLCKRPTGMQFISCPNRRNFRVFQTLYFQWFGSAICSYTTLYAVRSAFLSTARPTFLFHLAVLCARLPFSNAWQSNITSYQITLKPTCLWIGLSRQRIEYGHDLYRQVGVSGQKCWDVQRM